MRVARVLAVMLTTAAVGACINLDSEEQVKDLRVLAVRLDPPEILFNFMHLVPAEQRPPVALGPYGFSVKVLAVDPKGREVESFIRMCPDQSSLEVPCHSYVIRDTAPPEEIRAVTPLLDAVRATTTAQLPLGGELPIPDVRYTLVDRAVDYMLLHDADGRVSFLAYALPSFPSVIVRVRTTDGAEEEVAFKRFALNTDISPAGIPPEIRSSLQDLFEGILGVGFCPAGTDLLADVQCVKDRVANRNPTLERVLYRVGTDLEKTDDELDPTAGGQLRDLTGRPQVRPGASIRLRPVVGLDDQEPYQGLNYNFQTRAVELANFREDMAYAWYTTVGTVARITTTTFSPNADCTYDVSPDAPDGPAHVWMIVHDQRGGIDWRRLEFDVKARPTEDNPWYDPLGLGL